MEPSEGGGSHVKLFDLCCTTFYFKQEVYTIKNFDKWKTLSNYTQKWHIHCELNILSVTVDSNKSQQNVWTLKDIRKQNWSIILLWLKVKGCSHNSILVIIGDLTVVVNIFTLRKDIEEKRENPRFSTRGEQSLGRKGLGPDTSGLTLSACGRASELGLLQRSGLH